MVDEANKGEKMKDESSPQRELSAESLETKAITPIIVDRQSQQLVAKDNAELVRMIKIFMNGAALPRTLDTEAKIITAWQTAASLRIPPIRAIQNMAIIHGSLAIWGELPKALAESTGELEDFRMILIDDKQEQISLANKNLDKEVCGAVVQVKRKGRSMNEYSFTQADAQKAGLLSKPGPWKDYRKIMYQRRAMNHAMKFEFPDALMGVKIAEYDFNEAPDLSQARDVDTLTGASEINTKYLNKESK